VFDISFHYQTLGFVECLGFHLTLLVDSLPLCQLSLLVGSEGFYHALATSCVHRKHASVGLLHLFHPILPHYWPTSYTRARLMKDALMPSF